MKRIAVCVLLFVVLATFVYAADADQLKAATGVVFCETGGMGAGVFVDPTGYLVTAAHVVSGTGRIFVVTLDAPKMLIAEIVYMDYVHDLALLKVEREGGFPVAPWGDSDALEVGDDLWICGHTGGLAWMTTTGILSARKYSNSGQEYFLTDAWGYRGNSGGGMFNKDGELVAIVQMSAVGYMIGTTVNWFKPFIPGIIHAYETLKANKEMLERENQKWQEANKEIIEEWEQQREAQKKETEELRKRWAAEEKAKEKRAEQERQRKRREAHEAPARTE